MQLLNNGNFIEMGDSEGCFVPGSMLDKKIESPTEMLIIISHLVFNNNAYISVESQKENDLKKEIYAKDT